VSGAVVAVLLLLGSLFPQVREVSLVLVSAVVAVPVVVYRVGQSRELVKVAGFGVAVVVTLASAALLRAPVGEYGADKVTRLVTLTLLSAVAAVVVATPARLVAFARVWVVTAVVLAATATVGINAAGRAAGLDENNPVWLGRAIATGLVIVVWFVWSRRVRLVWAVPMIGLLAWGLQSTGSRGPLLGAVAGVLAIAAAGERRSRHQRLFVVGLGALAVLLAVVYLPGAGQTRFGGLVLAPGQELSGSARAALWGRALELGWLTQGGYGWGSWSYAAGSPVRYPHNLFLEVLVEAGWLYFAALLTVVVLVGMRLWRVARTVPLAQLALALLTTETVAVCTSGDVNARTWFFLLTLGFGASRWNDETAPPAEADGAAAPAGALSSRGGQARSYLPRLSGCCIIRVGRPGW
jgi:hypothetical protein